MGDVVICGLKNCRKSYRSIFRLKIHMIIRHGENSENYYFADDPLTICKNPKICKFFYPNDEKQINFFVSKKDVELVLNHDEYILSHMHNSRFEHHLLILHFGRKEIIPNGPFLELFEEKGDVEQIVITKKDLMFLLHDWPNDFVEFPPNDDAPIPLTINIAPEELDVG